MGSPLWLQELNLLLWLLLLLYSIWKKKKKKKIPHIQSCLSWLWHGAWTCFLTRSEDWGSVRGTCLCVRGLVGERVTTVSWLQRVKRLLNTTAPELQIFNNYLEDWGFYIKLSHSFVPKRRENQAWPREHPREWRSATLSSLAVGGYPDEEWSGRTERLSFKSSNVSAAVVQLEWEWRVGWSGGQLVACKTSLVQTCYLSLLHIVYSGERLALKSVWKAIRGSVFSFFLCIGLINTHKPGYV